MIVEDGMAMMGSDVIDRRCVNLVDRGILMECGLMCSHEMVCIDRRLRHFQDFVAWGSVVLGRMFAPMVPMSLWLELWWSLIGVAFELGSNSFKGGAPL